MHMSRLALGLLAIPAAVAFSSTPESMVTVKGITTDCDGAKSAAQPAPRVVVCAFTSVVPRVPQPVLQPSPLQPSGSQCFNRLHPSIPMAAMAEPDQVILFDTPQARASHSDRQLRRCRRLHSKLIATP